MSDYAYFDGEKWVENLTMKDIRSLAISGIIKDDTLIRIPDGKEIQARYFGLSFSNSPAPSGHRLFLDSSYDDDSRNGDESIMAPALVIIHGAYCLAVIGAVLSSIVAIAGLLQIAVSPIGIPILMTSCVAFGSFLYTALSLVVLKYFVKCVDSMELSFRRIERNTRKE